MSGGARSFNYREAHTYPSSQRYHNAQEFSLQFISNAIAILENKASLNDKLAQFYRIDPFSNNRSRQNPGNVLRYLFIKFARNYQQQSMTQKVNLLLDFTHAYQQQNLLFQLQPRDISTIILNLGSLARVLASKFRLPPALINVLMQILTQNIKDSDRPTEDIAHTLLGLGHLANTGYFFKLDADAVNSLFSVFTETAFNTDRPIKDIVHVLLGFGYLVHAAHPLKLDADAISLLLSLLARHIATSDWPIQNISNTLVGLGYLAQANYDFKLDSEVISSLFSLLAKHISTSDRPVQHIANTFLGLGYLVIANPKIKISTEAIASFISFFIKNLAHIDQPIQPLTNLLFGLCLLQVKDLDYYSDLLNSVDYRALVASPIQNLSQLHYVYGVLKLEFQDAYPVPEVLKKLEAFYQETKSKVLKPESSKTHLAYHKRLASALVQFPSLALEQEYYFYGKYLDSVILLNDQPWIVIEVQGPSHYNAFTESGLTFKDQEKIKFLQAHGLKVYNYDYREDSEAHILQLKQEIEAELNDRVREIKPSDAVTPVVAIHTDKNNRSPSTVKKSRNQRRREQWRLQLESQALAAFPTHSIDQSHPNKPTATDLGIISKNKKRRAQRRRREALSKQLQRGETSQRGKAEIYKEALASKPITAVANTDTQQTHTQNQTCTYIAATVFLGTGLAALGASYYFSDFQI